MNVFYDAQDEDAHDKFVEWKSRNPEGFVINCKARDETMLHRADCFHFVFQPDEQVSLTAIKKVCSLDRQELEAWAKKNKMALGRCSSCEV